VVARKLTPERIENGEDDEGTDEGSKEARARMIAPSSESMKSGSRLTRRWRGLDSNFQFRAKIGRGFKLPDGHRCASAYCLDGDVPMIEFV
jgi:hypothetical protein